MYRQGDVLIVLVANLPENLEKVPREKGCVVLAHGEATGHAHAIRSKGATLFRDPKLNSLFLKLDGSVSLDHEEHGSIALALGSYKVIRQREYSPEEIRNVAD